MNRLATARLRQVYGRQGYGEVAKFEVLNRGQNEMDEASWKFFEICSRDLSRQSQFQALQRAPAPIHNPIVTFIFSRSPVGLLSSTSTAAVFSLLGHCSVEEVSLDERQGTPSAHKNTSNCNHIVAQLHQIHCRKARLHSLRLDEEVKMNYNNNYNDIPRMTKYYHRSPSKQFAVACLCRKNGLLRPSSIVVDSMR